MCTQEISTRLIFVDLGRQQIVVDFLINRTDKINHARFSIILKDVFHFHDTVNNPPAPYSIHSLTD